MAVTRRSIAARHTPHARAQSPSAGTAHSRIARRLPWKVAIYWSLLSATWYALSGKFDLLHFGTGVVVALVIAMQSRSVDDGTRFRPIQFLMLVPWLIGQIVLSNLRVARSVLNPRLPIAPALVRMPPQVAGDRPLVLLGISTTLTPGTLTVDVGDDEMLVHALDQHSVDGLHHGAMARRVARVFGQEA
jgi:multicomponent Na+:H+ antiporter subunit E